MTFAFSTAVAGVEIASGAVAAGAQLRTGEAWKAARRHLSWIVALPAMPAARAAARSSALYAIAPCRRRWPTHGAGVGDLHAPDPRGRLGGRGGIARPSPSAQPARPVLLALLPGAEASPSNEPSAACWPDCSHAVARGDRSGHLGGGVTRLPSM